ncbi:M16 family metallopeptidase [Christiangramia sp. SM2212]|uniref:Insulinase family protein n=1 Tax=Christiangramia sediminicola TaxID=3073267 RepID=A0ABU1ERZ0_9FLAO|nr:insulinase family protein [Christiangramia sp. SM2212]MDR5591141.1 insulinase family protein [Christiangramia sp. SM2212]
MYQYLKKIIGLIALIIFSYPTQAQLGNSNQETTLAVDNSIRYGKLDNGLTYYIKPINGAKEKVFLKFHVKAGINQQEANQLDIAHAIEHIAFHPTKNFPNSIYSEKLLDGLGMHLYDIYAYSGRTTVYSFDAPNNDPKTINTALTWFKDISNELVLSNPVIEKVRGELRQEYITRGSDNRDKFAAESKLMSKMFPTFSDKSNFLSYNKSFKPEVLRKFYKNWYRPDLTAVSIVGSIEDVDDLESKLKNIFSETIYRENKLKYKNDAIQYLSLPNQFKKVKRVPDTIKGYLDDFVETWLIYRYESAKINTWEDLQNEKIKRIFNNVLMERLHRKSEVYNSSFTVSSHLPYKKNQNPNIPGLVIKIKSENNSERKAINETMKAIQQLKQFGVTEKEWKKYRFVEKANENSIPYWIEQIDKHFLYDEAIPSNKSSYLAQWIESLSRESFNLKLKNLFPEMPEDIGIIAPAGHLALQFKEKQIRQLIAKANKKSYQSYKLVETSKNLSSELNISKLKEKKIISRSIGISGAKEIILENGVRLILKPNKISSDIKDREILIKGVSPNGASCFPQDDFYSAVNSVQIIKHSGVGSMNKFVLDRFLDSKGIKKGPVSYVDFRETAIQGAAKSIDQLETVLQLIHLYFTKPRKDRIAYKDWQKEKFKNYKNPKGADVMSTDLYNYIRNITGDSTVAGDGVFGLKLLTGTENYQGMLKTDLNRSYEIYHELFGNAQDFTFIINGDFNTKIILPILQKYLGNLPKGKDSFCNHIPKIQTKFEGPLTKEITAKGRYKIEGVQYYSSFIFPVKNPDNWKEQIKVDALGWLLYHKMLQLRFKKGYALYSVGSGGRFNKDLSRYEIGIRLLAKSEDLNALRQEFDKIISNIKSGNIDESTFSASTHRLYSSYSVQTAKDSKEIQNKLYNHYHYNQPWIKPAEIEKFVKSLTSKDIAETAKKYCHEDNLIEVIMKDKQI